MVYLLASALHQGDLDYMLHSSYHLRYTFPFPAVLGTYEEDASGSKIKPLELVRIAFQRFIYICGHFGRRLDATSRKKSQGHGKAALLELHDVYVSCYTIKQLLVHYVRYHK